MITLDMIEDVKWFSGRAMVGIVLVRTVHGHKAYIGVGEGADEKYDSLSIALGGAKFYPYAAAVWPHIKHWCR